MERLIEIFFLTFISILKIIDGYNVGELVPYILICVTLTLLSITFRFKNSFYFYSVIYLFGCIYFSNLRILTPVFFYGISTVSPRWFNFLLIAAFLPIIKLNPTVILAIFALYLAYMYLEREERKEEFYRIKDSLRENEILNLKLRKQERIDWDKNTEIAILQERNRISRELHDSIGHTISSSLLQVEALKIIAPDNIKNKLEKMGQNLSRGMTDIRKTLHDMHAEALDLNMEVENMISPLKKDYSIRHVVQLDEKTPSAIKKAMLSIVREALTNIRKHSDADEISILIRELPSHYTLAIKDNGSKKPMNIKGIGLEGMEETSREIGGIFSYGYNEGFYLHLAVSKDKVQA